MSYRTLILNSVRLAFTSLGDIPEEVIYRLKESEPGYDAVSGEVVDSSVAYNITIVTTSFGTMQRKDPTLVKEDFTGKLVAYVIKGDRPGELPFKPRSSDLIVRNGEVLKIAGIRSDPTNILYTLLIDRP